MFSEVLGNARQVMLQDSREGDGFYQGLSSKRSIINKIGGLKCFKTLATDTLNISTIWVKITFLQGFIIEPPLPLAQPLNLQLMRMLVNQWMKYFGKSC